MGKEEKEKKRSVRRVETCRDLELASLTLGLEIRSFEGPMTPSCELHPFSERFVEKKNGRRTKKKRTDNTLCHVLCLRAEPYAVSDSNTFPHVKRLQAKKYHTKMPSSVLSTCIHHHV